MSKFTHPLQFAVDPVTGSYILGFNFKGQFVPNARFTPNRDAEVDSLNTYGVSQEEAVRIRQTYLAICNAVDVALDEAAKSLADSLGIDFDTAQRSLKGDRRYVQTVQLGISGMVCNMLND